ncbi:MAG: hypothetical protein R3B95_19515 [Nitrospirales bacterium]|nr:hypothetical protein [Nitrospirales bacterium]
MFENLIWNVRDSLKTAVGVGYHVAILLLSAGIAFSIPWAAGNLLTKWSVVESGKITLLSIEIGVAVFLIILCNFLRQSYRDRQIARMADGAGLVLFFASRGLSVKKKIRKLKEKHGRGRVVKILGSSGYATFVDQVGDLSELLGKCLGAKILLMNPFSSEASTRIRAVADPNFTLEWFRDEVMQSIQLLKRLKAMGKNVKLKLYSEPPLIKLVILGDYLWLQHYHADLDIQMMPEFVFQHHSNHHGLYTVFYQYFNQKWESHEIPDYDLDTDELVYRDPNGQEIERVPFLPNDGFKLPVNDRGNKGGSIPMEGKVSLPVRQHCLEVGTERNCGFGFT